jgi:hypothetical protein
MLTHQIPKIKRPAENFVGLDKLGLAAAGQGWIAAASGQRRQELLQTVHESSRLRGTAAPAESLAEAGADDHLAVAEGDPECDVAVSEVRVHESSLLK